MAVYSTTGQMCINVLQADLERQPGAALLDG